MGSGTSAISVCGLTKRFGGFTAVENLCLDVKRGEFMGILGPNGSGKSTALKCVVGLMEPTSGEIRINGIDISDHRAAMTGVGTIVETPETYMSFTPSETLDYVGRLYGMSQAEIAARSRVVLEDVKLWDWRGKRVSTFSKGMRQRTMIAQAMLPDPEILILDEPTSGLDPRGMVEMREVLAGLRRKGMTALISTHMLKEVSELCGSVTMINRGKTVASGDVNLLIREFASRSEHRTSISLRTRKPVTDAFLSDVRGIDGASSVERVGAYETRLVFTGSDDGRVSISEAVGAHGLGLISMTETGADLERLYMELTKEGAVSE